VSSSLPNPPPHLDAAQLGDFPSADRRVVTISILAIVVGVIGALVAAALDDLIDLVTNLFYYGRFSVAAVAPANSLGILTIVIPVAGGLIVGLMARFGSEGIRGHGIPETIDSILIDRSRVAPKLAVLKPVSSAVSIGTGGPFGVEGPIIMTGGALGSVFGQFLRLSAAERKTLMVAGAAAGLAAIFNTPFAAVLFAVEVLLFEWKPRSLIPVGIASATATFLSWYLVPAHGFGPLFPIAMSGLPTGWILAGAALVGLLAGALAILLTWAVDFFEDAFRRLRVHWMWWPAIGGVVVGVGGLIVVESLGVGYGSVCALLSCTNTTFTAFYPAVALTLVFVVSLLVVKAIIWSFALGSGTSGGVIAPLLIIGGSLGAIEAHFLPFGSTPLWVLISMGATLGGTMRSPFTGIVFAVELTHDINALAPLLVAALVADGFTVLALKRSILTEKAARRGVAVADEYSVDPLELTTVRTVMHTAIWPIRSDLTVEEALRTTTVDPPEAVGLALLGEDGVPEGFVSRADLERYLGLGGDPTARVRSRAAPLSAATYPDEPLRSAAGLLQQLDGLAVPVVDPGDPTHVIGFITRESPFDARMQWNKLDEERDRVYSLSFVEVRRRLQAWFRRSKRPPASKT
jgi:chloride channel protein, CIC family